MGIALLVGACAAERGYDFKAVNWDNPTGGVAASLRTAQRSMAFDIHVPEGLGSPASIFITRPSDLTFPEDRSVTFVYDTKAFGRVAVTEHIPQIPLSEYGAYIAEVVELSHGSEASGHAEIVQIRGGRQALITTAEDESRSSIFWLEEKIEIVVRGPSLTMEQCAAIAERI